VGEGGRAHPKVGAVVVKGGMVLASAHRGQLGAGEHAEYTALERSYPPPSSRARPSTPHWNLARPANTPRFPVPGGSSSERSSGS
jgi:pyrimidine deaminase RibD-like protein